MLWGNKFLKATAQVSSTSTTTLPRKSLQPKEEEEAGGKCQERTSIKDMGSNIFHTLYNGHPVTEH